MLVRRALICDTPVFIQILVQGIEITPTGEEEAPKMTVEFEEAISFVNNIKDEKEKRAALAVQLNIIHLLAEMNVVVNNPEVVDMILPLFIESLEEGDASTPDLLRLRLLDVVSRMASLCFKKSYREAIVLMIRSYLSKLSTV